MHEFVTPTAAEIIAAVQAMEPTTVIGKCQYAGACLIAEYLDKQYPDCYHLVYPDAFNDPDEYPYEARIWQAPRSVVDEDMALQESRFPFRDDRVKQIYWESSIRALGVRYPLPGELNALALLFDGCGLEGEDISARQFLRKAV